MGLSLVTAANGEPISLDETKLHLRVDLGTEDELIVSKMGAARSYLEEICGRAFLSSTWDYKIDEAWPWVLDLGSNCYQQVIEIPKAPLQSVTSITYVDTAGVTQTLASNQYVVDATGPIGRIYPAYGVTWPSVRCQRQAITVRFVAGYGAATAVPQPIKQALLLLTAHFHTNREPVTDKTAAELPLAVSSLIAPFRVYF